MDIPRLLKARAADSEVGDRTALESKPHQFAPHGPQRGQQPRAQQNDPPIRTTKWPGYSQIAFGSCQRKPQELLTIIDTEKLSGKIIYVLRAVGSADSQFTINIE